MAKHLNIVVPVYNEEENIGILVTALHQVLQPFSDRYTYNVIVVNDGSSDRTLEVIKALCTQDTRVRYVSFSRNFGHQNALKAGIDRADADCVISLDGDMQHPPELIPTMLEKWEEGFDVVYTLRQSDESNLAFVKRQTSNWFYRVMNRLADLEMEKGTADFRLLDRKVVDVLKDLTEFELFFRGLVKWMGFKQFGIEYKANERRSGRSKYTLKKMMRFAVQGITSFSIKPLYIAAYLGLAFSLASLIYIPYALISYYLGYAISGWTSVIVTIAFFGGLQLSILGIIGLYIGKIFMQGKHRPLYIVAETNL
jgi:polyisoprenyl-phosphate glycosyltransferase